MKRNRMREISVICALVMNFSSLTAYAEEAKPAQIPSCPVVTYTGDTSVFAWSEYLTETDKIAYDEIGCLDYYAEYMDLFDDFLYVNENTEVGDLCYYVYDPTAHGFDADQAYPVSIWFHGGGNQTLGKQAMVAAGAASYASDAFQQDVGGMYIIVPVAAEKGWNVGTVNAVKGMYDNVRASHRTTDELIVCGTSAGGKMLNNWLEQYAYMTDIVFWMSTWLPDVDTVQKYSDMGIKMWYEVARHDTVGAYEASFPEGAEAYDGIENFEYTVFDWIRWGDGSIAIIGQDDSASGQHCTCVQVLRNLIQDDGTPDDPAHPRGITGWFKDQLDAIRTEN